MQSQYLLESFTQYCKEHPTERFWQALRNWCGWNFVLVCQDPDKKKVYDTFYWNNKDM